ncbi:unnamed protein product [Phytophthora fragariaefolia]|uniref:Unnamed protein product n=1 Tax=Phytophthora fragariaefolia TaxID=1490495 RepID=A0A9W6XC74_9STRA|nr:unnamed protein product [Phytophthora fragariaefolia]
MINTVTEDRSTPSVSRQFGRRVQEDIEISRSHFATKMRKVSLRVTTASYDLASDRSRHVSSQHAIAQQLWKCSLKAMDCSSTSHLQASHASYVSLTGNMWIKSSMSGVEWTQNIYYH